MEGGRGRKERGLKEKRGRGKEKDQRGQKRNEYPQSSGHFGRVANRKDHSKFRQRQRVRAIGDGGWGVPFAFALGSLTGARVDPFVDSAKLCLTSFSSVLRDSELCDENDFIARQFLAES